MTDRISTSLGKQLSFHPLTLRDNRILRWLLLASAGALGAVGVWRWYIGYTQFGVAAGEGWSRPWFAAAVLLLLALLIDGLRRRRLQRRFAAVYKKGLKTHLPGRKAQALRWEEIAGVTVDAAQTRLLGMNLSNRTQFIVTSNLNGDLRMGTELDNLSTLIDNVKREYYAFVLPRLQNDLAAKKWLYFGPIALNQQELKVHGKPTSLAEIRRIHVDSGKLQIERQGKKVIKIRADQIPNLELLLKMIEGL